MNGVSSSQNKNFREEKREFWWWPPFFLAMMTGIVLFYQSYETDKAIWATSKEITVKVFDKIRGGPRQKHRVGVMHEHIPIYVYAGSKWFRQTKIGSDTLVRYSSRYHAYMDPFHKFNVDLFFLVCMIVFNAVILWRATWLGLYIWYWKD